MCNLGQNSFEWFFFLPFCVGRDIEMYVFEMFEAILCNLLQPMFVHDGLASEVTRIVSTAGPLLTACFVVFLFQKFVKVDASI